MRALCLADGLALTVVDVLVELQAILKLHGFFHLKLVGSIIDSRGGGSEEPYRLSHSPSDTGGLSLVRRYWHERFSCQYQYS